MMKRVLLCVLVLTSVACNRDQASETKSDPVAASGRHDDKGASAVTGAAGTKFTDSTGRTVVVGKDGKITVPGVTQDPPAP
jgi:hypothetical protein